MFKHPFSFEGRIGRSEYAITYVAYIVFAVIAQILAESSPLFVILYIPTLWLLFAQGSKRCHDLGKGGGWQIIPFYVFWLLFQPGDEGANEYGFPNSHPKDNPVNSIEKEIESIGQSDV